MSLNGVYDYSNGYNCLDGNWNYSLVQISGPENPLFIAKLNNTNFFVNASAAYRAEKGDYTFRIKVFINEEPTKINDEIYFYLSIKSINT